MPRQTYDGPRYNQDRPDPLYHGYYGDLRVRENFDALSQRYLEDSKSTVPPRQARAAQDSGFYRDAYHFHFPQSSDRYSGLYSLTAGNDVQARHEQARTFYNTTGMYGFAGPGGGSAPNGQYPGGFTGAGDVPSQGPAVPAHQQREEPLYKQQARGERLFNPALHPPAHPGPHRSNPSFGASSGPANPFATFASTSSSAPLPPQGDPRGYTPAPQGQGHGRGHGAPGPAPTM